MYTCTGSKYSKGSYWHVVSEFYHPFIDSCQKLCPTKIRNAYNFLCTHYVRWNQSVLTHESKVSCSRKQWRPLKYKLMSDRQVTWLATQTCCTMLHSLVNSVTSYILETRREWITNITSLHIIKSWKENIKMLC